MPAGGFSIGRDVSLTFNFPQGPVTFKNVVGFTRQQISTGLESKGLDGVDDFAEIPSGWQGTCEIDRKDPAADIAFAKIEDMYYAGQNIPYGTFSETTTEANGTTTQFRYVRVAVKFDNAGDAKGDAKITQTFSWKASRRRLISSS